MPVATAAHTASIGLVCGFAGVAPYLASKPHTALHRPSCGFVSQNEVPPPPKGGGAGYHLSWVGRVGSVRSKPGHAGSTGPTLFLAGAGSPTRPPKPHTGPHRGVFGFTVFSWCASFAVVPLTGAPGGNSPPREWAEPCKAASRFSRSRPMSTR